MDLNKQTAAIAGLMASLANVSIAFGLFDPTIAAAVQSTLYGIAALVLTVLHKRDANVAG